MENTTQNNLSDSTHTIEDAFECPSCNSKINSSQVAIHCQIEMERLRQIQTEAAKIAKDVENNVVAEQQRRKPYTVFQRIQRNRQTRLKRSRRRATPPVTTEHVCPICNMSFPQNEIQRHADRCLQKSNGHSNDGDNSSNEDDEEGYSEEYEEYEWAGQKRIRASSLLEGGYASLGIGQSTTNRNGSNDTDDEDLNVDEDDTQIYGPAQYNEADVIPNEDDASSKTSNYMRSLISNAGKKIENLENNKHSNGFLNDSTENKSTVNILNCNPSSSTSSSFELTASSSKSSHSMPLNYQQIIESLKSKLRHYENLTSKYKCLICLDDYKKPAISVACWHVHCEDCWLRSLGARKLCPQCNLITTPKDLRRIYM